MGAMVTPGNEGREEFLLCYKVPEERCQGANAGRQNKAGKGRFSRQLVASNQNLLDTALQFC